MPWDSSFGLRFCVFAGSLIGRLPRASVENTGIRISVVSTD
jgi:hypothetical protein